MSGSAAERHLRGLVVDRLRVVAPSARIVHELNVDTGRCRVDIAAITPDRIMMVEIKSRKDKLDRLPEQTRAFGPVCHDLAVAYASERWSYSQVRSVTGYGCDLWPEDNVAGWSFMRYDRRRPNTTAMLNLLWQSELQDEAERAGFQPRKRTPRTPLMNLMWDHMTGEQVVRAVCRQLRARPFAEGDAPVHELAVAA